MKRRNLVSLLACLALTLGTVGFAGCDLLETDSAGNSQNSSVTESSNNEENGSSVGNEEITVTLGTEGLAYEKIDGKDEYCVVGMGTAMENGIVIASHVEGLPVTRIAENAFAENEHLYSVTITENITEIAQGAFTGCSRLVEVVNYSKISIDAGYSSNKDGNLGEYALVVFKKSTYVGTRISNDNGYIVYDDGTDKILIDYIGEETSLTLPSYITKIKDHALSEYNAIVSVNIPEGVTEIGAYAFGFCAGLTNISIPNSLTYVGYGAFVCDNMDVFGRVNHLEYYEENGLKYLGNAENPYVYLAGATGSGATRNIKTAVINENCKFVGDYAFDDCVALESVTLSKNIISIGYGAFAGCTRLSNLEIFDGVKRIDSFAFSGCRSLTELSLTASLEWLGEDIFHECGKLTSLTFVGKKSQWRGIDKESAWKEYSSLTEVVCSDGTITL